MMKSKKVISLVMIICILVSLSTIHSFQNAGAAARFTPYWVKVVSGTTTAEPNFDREIKHSGKASMCLSNATPLTPKTNLTLQQEINIEKNTSYDVSLWVKAEEISSDSAVYVTTDSAASVNKYFEKGTYDWKKVSFTFKSDENTSVFKFTLGIQDIAKKVWIDDITLKQTGKYQNFVNNGDFEITSFNDTDSTSEDLLKSKALVKATIFRLGSSQAIVNAKRVMLDINNPLSTPVRANGVVYIPASIVSQIYDGDYSWNSVKKTGSIKSELLTLEFTVDSKKAKVNGKDLKALYVPQIINSTMMIPARSLKDLGLVKNIKLLNNSLYVLSDLTQAISSTEENILTKLLPLKIQSMDINTFFEAPSRTTNDGIANCIATFKDNTYTAWIDDKLNIVVGKYDKSGNLKTSVVTNNVSDDRYHVRPSVGIDNDGYIHISGGTHHKPWNYFVSDKPEDISSFTNKSATSQCPPGTGVTYTKFFNDNNGVLYVTYRQWVRPAKINGEDSWYAGDLGGGLAKYDTKTKTWEGLGGTDYRHKTKTLVWVDAGSVNGFYNAFKQELYFDKNNRMHTAWLCHTVNTGKNDSNTATYLMYAYSDDGGQTFNKADGTKITHYPMTPSDATVVLDRTKKADIENGFCIGATSNGRPIIGVRVAETGANIRIWNGYTFEPMGNYPKAQPWFKATPDGMMVAQLYRANKTSIFYVSNDNGETWTMGPEYPILQAEFDMRYFRDTGNLRWMAMSYDYKKVIVGSSNIKY